MRGILRELYPEEDQNELLKRITGIVETYQFEKLIIETVKELLTNLGYDTLVALGGRDAIAVYEKNKDHIHMVILDLIMPDMGGGAVYDRLKEINPDVKVLLSSGYSIGGAAQEILDRGCNDFIQKPFNLSRLSRKIRKLLDQE